jgi:putative ABC transport system substrate-binding protein
MKRRDFLAVLGGAATVWPLGARGQQTAIVGVLLSVSPEGYAERMRAFRHGLQESGYIEGQNVTLEYRWAEGQMDRLPALATDLVRQKVAVIAALGGPSPAVAAKAATTTIPIVFGTPDDPVKLGLVKSLARPGGNLTGVHYFTGELVAKRLELLRRLVPKTKRIAMFVNPANSTRMASIVRETETAGLKTGSSGEIVAAFNALVAQRPDAIFVAPDPFFQGHRVQLVELVIGPWRWACSQRQQDCHVELACSSAARRFRADQRLQGETRRGSPPRPCRPSASR